MRFAYRNDSKLDRSIPQGKVAFVMLNQKRKDSFNAAEQGAMDYNGCVILAVAADIFHLETLR